MHIVTDIRILSFSLLLSVSGVVNAELNVFTCEPEWAALVKEIGGDKVVVHSATTAFQDPHHIQARPSLIAKARRADLMVCSGAELETGWLPVLLRKSGNANIQPGSDGMFFAANAVELKDKPKVVDRSHGDVHASGNPHIHTDPRIISIVASQLSKRMQALDAENAAYYDRSAQSFISTWDEAIERWQRQASGLSAIRIITHHRYWFYLADWLGIETVAQLEPVPGVQPTVAHLSKLQSEYADKADMIVRVNYSDARAAEWLSSRTDLPVVELQSTVDFQGGQSLQQWFDFIIDRLTSK